MHGKKRKSWGRGVKGVKEQREGKVYRDHRIIHKVWGVGFITQHLPKSYLPLPGGASHGKEGAESSLETGRETKGKRRRR